MSPVRPSLCPLVDEEEEAEEGEQEEARAQEGEEGQGKEEMDEETGGVEGERGEESRSTLKLPRMRRVSRAEREEHERTGHACYRNWCDDCVAGRGKSHIHKVYQHPTELENPIVSLDYGFLGPRCKECDEDDPDILTMFLAVKSKGLECLAGVAVPEKGFAGGYTAKKVSSILDAWGHGPVCLRSDGERAIESVKQDIKEWRRDDTTLLEKTPPGDHAANGPAEQAVQAIAGLFRTNKRSLEKRLGGRIGSTRPVLKWLIEYVGVMYCLHKVGTDGRTPRERATGGRSYRRPLAPFGQKVMFEIRPKRDRRERQHEGKMECKFDEGIFLGPKAAGVGYWVADRDGNVNPTNVIKQVPEDSQWDLELVRHIKGLPWDPAPERDAEETERREQEEADEHESPPARHSEGEPPIVEEPERRAFKITERALGRYGRSPGCPACEGKRGYGHTQACRERIETAVMAEGEASRVRVERARADKAASAEKRKNEAEDASQTETPAKRRSGPRPILKRGRDDESVHERSNTRLRTSHDEPRHEVHFEQVGEHFVRVPQSERSSSSGENPDPVIETEPSSDDTITAIELEELKSLHESLEGGCPDAAEIYSPPRVTAMAPQMNLKAGFALDLTVPDERGYEWNFSKAECRRRARERVINDKPLLLVGSPPCTMYSRLQALLMKTRDPEAIQRLMIEANTHLLFCLELYRIQKAAGRLYLHEHPSGAASWWHPDVDEFRNEPGNIQVVSHACAFGMKSRDAYGEGSVLKPTRWLTNSIHIAQSLERKCPNLGKAWEDRHRHVQLLQNRAGPCAIYPPKLCRAILTGLVNEMRHRRSIPRFGLGVVCEDGQAECMLEELVCEVGDDDCDGYLVEGGDTASDGLEHPHDRDPNLYDEFYRDATFTDDLTGKTLDTEGVKEARRVELGFVDKKPVYTERTLEECYRVTGKGPIDTKWVDVDKGGPGAHQLRSRWVAKDFKTGPNDEFFSATPPYECVKLFVFIGGKSGADEGEAAGSASNGVERR